MADFIATHQMEGKQWNILKYQVGYIIR
jgi:hypothetical protein